jgi:DNA/RNA-binding domain of Phe-tRNA-synthetase-like protein
MSLNEICIEKSIEERIPACRLGYLLLHDLTIQSESAALQSEISLLRQGVSEQYTLEGLSQVTRIAAVRSMYKKMSWDPSRYRPSAEALVRRILQKKDLYQINSAVDASNYCSIKFLLPFGLYDADKLNGSIRYQVATEGEYSNIGGKTVKTEGKPFLSDENGVFGNPTSDAKRTAVTLLTKKVLSVVYADEEITTRELSEILSYTAEKIRFHNGGRLIKQGIVTACDDK